MEKKFTSQRAQELYKQLRRYRNRGKFAVEFIYNLHSSELESNRIDIFGFGHIMEVCHVFWSSRGTDTERDLENETWYDINDAHFLVTATDGEDCDRADITGGENLLTAIYDYIERGFTSLFVVDDTDEVIFEREMIDC